MGSDDSDSEDAAAPAALDSGSASEEAAPVADPLAALPAGALPEDVQQDVLSVLTEEPAAAVAPAAVVPFTGRWYRLD